MAKRHTLQLDFDNESTGFLLDLHAATVRDLDAFAFETSLEERDYRDTEKRLVTREVALRQYLHEQRKINLVNLPSPSYIGETNES